MRTRIIYNNQTGARKFYIDDVEHSEDEYKEKTQSQDEQRLVEMLQSGRTPHCISDQTYMKGHANGSQFAGTPQQGDYYKQVTESMGGNTNNKRYISGLARFPGDPEAWVTGRDDVKRIVEQRGWGCEGTVNVQPRQALNPHTPGPEVAEDLLEDYTNMIAAQDPNPHLVDRIDLKEQVKERIKPRRKKTVTKADG